MEQIAALRRNKIREQIIKEGSVSSEKLARQFSVSKETIRRDLKILEKEGDIEKNYGGAISIPEIQSVFKSISPVQKRMFTNLKEKKSISEEAVKCLKSGASIFLDSGSTAHMITNHLAPFKQLTVITNSIDTAKVCAGLDNVILIVLGGQFVKNSMCMVGPEVEKQISKLYIDIAFMGASGVSAKGFCLSTNPYEANVKRQVVKSSKKKILLVDSSKWEHHDLYKYATFDEIDWIITSDKVSRDTLVAIQEFDTPVTFVKSRR